MQCQKISSVYSAQMNERRSQDHSPVFPKQMNIAYCLQSSIILYFFKAAGKTFQHGSSNVTLKLLAAETASFCADDEEDPPDIGAEVAAGVVEIEEGNPDVDVFEMRDLFAADGVPCAIGVEASDWTYGENDWV